MVFLSEPAITSITFFAGADLKKSQSWLGERLSLVCQANPWLAGRLVRDKKVHKNVLLALPQSIMKDDVSALLCEDNTKKVLSSISIKTKYDVLCETLLKSDFVVGPGYKLIGKDLRVSKFGLVPVGDGVALVVSLTHAIADGKSIKSQRFLFSVFFHNTLVICGRHVAVKVTPTTRL